MKWFDGETYNDEHDRDRLKRQLYRVWAVIYNGNWLTLQEIKRETGDPLQSISARLRDFRKSRFGGHEIQRRRRHSPQRGLFEYRLIGTK